VTPRAAARRAAIAALAAAAAFAGGSASGHGDEHPPAQPPGSPRFEPPPPGSYALPPIQRVSEARLLGSDGEPAPLLGLGSGEVAVISFVYLSCGEACPLATATLHSLDADLAADPDLARRVQLVTISFDPVRDTPEAMARLERGLHPKGRWRFLTARDAQQIAPVLADFGQDAVWLPSEGDAAAPDRLRHVLKVFLVDDTGAVRNIYSTGLLDRRLLVNDLKTVLGEN